MAGNVTTQDLWAALQEIRSTTNRIDNTLTDIKDFKDDAKDGLSDLKDFIYTDYFIYVCVFFGLVVLANTLIVLYFAGKLGTGTYKAVRWTKRRCTATPSSESPGSTSSGT